MINCAHPTHFAAVLEDGGAWLERIGGLRANASTHEPRRARRGRGARRRRPRRARRRSTPRCATAPAGARACSAAAAAPTPATSPRSPPPGRADVHQPPRVSSSVSGSGPSPAHRARGALVRTAAARHRVHLLRAADVRDPLVRVCALQRDATVGQDQYDTALEDLEAHVRPCAVAREPAGDLPVPAQGRDQRDPVTGGRASRREIDEVLVLGALRRLERQRLRRHGVVAVRMVPLGGHHGDGGGDGAGGEGRGECSGSGHVPSVGHGARTHIGRGRDPGSLPRAIRALWDRSRERWRGTGSGASVRT